MKNISKTIVFFGSGPVATKSLDFLSTLFDIEAVITKPVPLHHKGIAPVESLAKKLGLRLLFAGTQNDLNEVIDKHKFHSSLGVIIDYGVIASEQVIQSFRLGIVNSHFSLLPKLRGADPITFSILSGESKTGVSLMLIENDLDTGKLLAQKSTEIQTNETTPSLTIRLIDLSNKMLEQYIPLYFEGKIKPKAQPHPDRATYSRKLTKNDSKIDWSKPADVIEREIRAFIGWPGSKAELFGKSITVTKAHVTSTKDDDLDMQCGNGLYLSIDELIAPSGKTMDSKSFINGYAVG